MEYGILGPLTVSRGGRELRLGGAKQRSVLAVLLLQANELVPTARIVDGLWGERPPATAVKAVQIQVSKLRKLLDEGAIETRPTGYLLRVEPGALDLERFEGLLERGREQLAAGDAKDAGGLLREALGLWRGSPLGEFTYETFARNEIGRLEELRLAALELRLEADLALGRHGEVVGELEGLVRDHPLRESFSRLLILALYRAGRQADALTAYRETRTALVDELGLDPSQALQQLEAQILRHDRALEPPAQRHEDSPRVAQPSGTVTLVFTDVEGSTRLLSELGRDAYREALGAHRRAVREAFGRYDGYEVDNDGDSFFYAFTTAAGAVSAVQEAMAALEGGPIAIRAGIHTGEPALDPPKYVGLEVHTAARIMAVGHGGQVVLSQSTRDLLDDSRTLTDLGEHRLKDLSVPRRLYQLGTAEFPRLRTLHRTNLPVPATEFIGRARELQDVVERLRDGVRLLTLTGPGETGKTRLALQAAAEAADDFGEGVWWVPLAALRDPALVLRQTAQTLGVIEQPDRPLEDVLAEILGGKRMLLLLDNAEHLLPAAAVAIAALRDLHGPRLIVTSRERLQVAGEHVYPVPQLSAPEGLDLFTARAVALDPSFQASPAVQELCDRLDNLPLALELAAARCAVLTPEQMIDRLGNRLDLLKGGRDADPRQQTLRATIAWSYELLAQDERDVFARFAVFAGGATLEAVEDVCGTDLETIASLVEKSLVRRDGERYWMLETIREYAEEQLEAAGEAGELRGRHAGYFLELAEQAEPEMWGLQQRIWFDRLDSEHDNLRAALTATLAASEADTATRLAAALEPFWETRGHVQEGWRWLTQVLAAETGVAKVSRAKALYAADRLAALTHMHQEEKPLLEEAVTLFAEAGEQRGHISSLSHLGIALDRLGEPDEARRRHEEAVSLAKALDDHWLLAMALNNLSCTLMEHGDYAAARPLAEESLALRRALGEKRGIAVSLGTVAELALAVGDGESALPLLEESLAILRELGHVEYEAWTTTELGLAWLYASDREQARLVLEQALGLCLELDRGHTEAEADCLSGLATLAGLDGDTERSARLFGAAEAAREAIGIVPSPCVRPIYERLLPEIAADANEQALAASWQKGRLQSPAEAAGLGVHDPH